MNEISVFKNVTRGFVECSLSTTRGSSLLGYHFKEGTLEHQNMQSHILNLVALENMRMPHANTERKWAIISLSFGSIGIVMLGFLLPIFYYDLNARIFLGVFGGLSSMGALSAYLLSSFNRKKNLSIQSIQTNLNMQFWNAIALGQLPRYHLDIPKYYLNSKEFERVKSAIYPLPEKLIPSEKSDEIDSKGICTQAIGAKECHCRPTCLPLQSLSS